MLGTILAAKISLYTHALFLGYRPFLSQNLPVKDPYDPIAEQDAASSSRQRQHLLDTLRQSETALDALTLSRCCIQSYHALRKMLQRLVHQGQLVSPARGLFTTPGHPCLLHFSPDASVPNTSPIAPTADQELLTGQSSNNPIAPIENAHNDGLAAPLVASVGLDSSTQHNPPIISPSTIPIIPDQPSVVDTPSSESHVPNVASAQNIIMLPPGTNPLPSESYVPNVATTQTSQPRPQLDASDLYPSVMIRPPKEDYEWILRRPPE